MRQKLSRKIKLGYFPEPFSSGFLSGVGFCKPSSLNLFSEEDTCLFRTLLQGEFVISGFTNKHLCQYFADRSASQIARLVARLRVHGIIRKVAKCYTYYLTDLGRQWASMTLKLREMVIIPDLALPAAL